ncbi:GNAT family N-acetyltransferase [Aestuariivirga sp.]|uniref:GNAT family N-acetyltransferase n=1 Tax=Aestuariivirga sp. TaxID=2650926 RepID=UPI0039E65A7C
MEQANNLGLRALNSADAPAYRAFRLKMLALYPAAFTTTLAEAGARDVAWYRDRIADKARPDDFILGAFDKAALCGMAGLERFTRASDRHKATLFGMAVDPDYQQRGVGEALVRGLIAEARKIDGLLQIHLEVTEGNRRAEDLYLRCGFIPYGTEPRAVIHQRLEFDKTHMVLMLDA